MENKTVPEGYLKNAQGHLVPLEVIKEIDLTRDALVNELIEKAKGLNKTIASFKDQSFGDIAAFVQLSAEKYDAKVGGNKGNVSLFSYDGKYKIQVASQEQISFDERLQAAKSLIDACIDEWSEGSRPEIIVLVQQAFDTDKEGKLNTGRVLALRRLEIEDKRWQEAMKAISESLQVVGSKQYVRYYERNDETLKYEPINLNIAA